MGVKINAQVSSSNREYVDAIKGWVKLKKQVNEEKFSSDKPKFDVKKRLEIRVNKKQSEVTWISSNLLNLIT